MSAQGPACDRCGVCDRFVHLIGWAVGEERCWLCQACINTIVLAWLLEHRQLVMERRRKRQGEEVEPC